jgi:hypothetical protein
MVPSWLGGGSSSGAKSLPAPAGTSSNSAAASASAAASSAAASASAAAQKVSSAASEWFGVLSAKVQGRDPPPTTNTPAVDLESGAGGGEAGSRGLLSTDPGGATSGLSAQFSSELNALTTLSWKQRLIAFMMSLTVGLVMLFLAFSFLPMVFVGAPAKFAISYALANFLLLGSSCFLVGPSKQLAQMFNGDRALPSSIYIGSLVLTFYVAWQYRSFFIVVPVLVIQFISLAVYVMSYVPFGQGQPRSETHRLRHAPGRI